MLTPAAELAARSQAHIAPVRLLHAWHLLSLDAPTVAFCWALLFARAGRVPHPVPQALALAGAVWLIYVADRLLDTRKEIGCGPAEAFTDLSAMYRLHARAFLWMLPPVCTSMAWLVSFVPRTLLQDWSLLGIPLLGYAVAVHWLHLAPCWKIICIGAFFGSAVALPVATHTGISWPLCLAVLLFACVCMLNCAMLRGDRSPVRWLYAGCASMAWFTCMFTEFQQITVAAVLALLLLRYLQQRRTHVGPLTYRALADAALVIPALLLLVC